LDNDLTTELKYRIATSSQARAIPNQKQRSRAETYLELWLEEDSNETKAR